MRRFWAKIGVVPDTDACWPWNGYMPKRGSLPCAPLFLGGRMRQVTVRQVAFIYHHRHAALGKVVHPGEEPPGVYCCNPHHLVDLREYSRRWASSLVELRDTKVDMDPETGCWIWRGEMRGSDGPVGRMYDIGNPRKVKQLSARRVVWSLAHERPAPRSYTFDASCGNERCVAPEHIISRRWTRPPAVKLTDADVKAIRRRGRELGYPRGFAEEMARAYNVATSTITRIWDHERR